MKAIRMIAIAICVLHLCGCEQTQGEKLFNAAFQEEQQYPVSAIWSYQLVIKSDPKSPWAQKAQQRIDALRLRQAAIGAESAARDAAADARRTRLGF